jgi:hypothetical protein
MDCMPFGCAQVTKLTQLQHSHGRFSVPTACHTVGRPELWRRTF